MSGRALLPAGKQYFNLLTNLHTMEDKFNEAGVDAVLGRQLMQMMDLSPMDFVDNARFRRFQDVIKFFKEVPNPGHIIRHLTIGKHVDKLDHIWGYTELQGQRERMRGTIADMMHKIEAYDAVGDKYSKDMRNKLNEEMHGVKAEMKNVESQIKQYE